MFNVLQDIERLSHIKRRLGSTVATTVVAVGILLCGFFLSLDDSHQIWFPVQLPIFYNHAFAASAHPTPIGNIGDTDSLLLDGASGVEIYKRNDNFYAVVTSYEDDGVQILDLSDPHDLLVVGHIGDTDSLLLDGASGVAVFEHDNTDYAVVTSYEDDGVQILDLSDPNDPTAIGNIGDTDSLELDGASGVAVFEHDGKNYAAVASYEDDGVQILDLSDPDNPTAVSKISDTDSLELDGAYDITAYKRPVTYFGVVNYVAVASYNDRGLQIINLDDPENPTSGGKFSLHYTNTGDAAAGVDVFEHNNIYYAAVTIQNDYENKIFSSHYPLNDSENRINHGIVQIVNLELNNLSSTSQLGDTGSLELDGAHGIAVFNYRGANYAAVAAEHDDGVQVLDLSDPANPKAVGKISDADSLELDGASKIDVFEHGDSIYAVVASYSDDGIQFIDVLSTDPSLITNGNPTAAGKLLDKGSRELGGASNVEVFEHDGKNYAIVTAEDDDGVQILNLSDPANPKAVGHISDTGSLELDGATEVAVFEHDGANYAIVTGYNDDGVQILDISNPARPTSVATITNTGSHELDGASGVAVFEHDGTNYAVIAAEHDDGVQVLDLSDPTDPTKIDDLHEVRNISDTDSLELDGASGITVFEHDGTNYAIVAAKHDDGVQILQIGEQNIKDHVRDTDSLELDGASGVSIYKHDGKNYAVVASYDDDGIQILDLSDPTNPNPLSRVRDDSKDVLGGATGTAIFDWGGNHVIVTGQRDDGVQLFSLDDPTHPLFFDLYAEIALFKDTGSLELDGAAAAAIFEHDDRQYAAVASSEDDGVQIINLYCCTAGHISDTGSLELDGAAGIATFKHDGKNYAAVASSEDDGVQILDLSDPDNPTAAGKISNTGSLELDGATAVAVFEHDGTNYAIVAAEYDDGVQILDLSDPDNPTAAGNIKDTGSLELDGATAVAVFEHDGTNYAIVAAKHDDGVQILDISDPANPTPIYYLQAAGNIKDTGSLALDGANRISIFEHDGRNHAVVVSYGDDGVQILDISDPTNITHAGHISDTKVLELDGAWDVVTFQWRGHDYAIIASYDDDGVQILNISDPTNITYAGHISDTKVLELDGASGVDIFEHRGNIYAIIASYDDHGIQIIDVFSATSSPVW